MAKREQAPNGSLPVAAYPKWLCSRVRPIGYFVYRNGKINRKAFGGKLEFDVHIFR
jgi:hypothetical protein